MRKIRSTVVVSVYTNPENASVAEKVVKDAHCPVLVLRAQAAENAKVTETHEVTGAD